MNLARILQVSATIAALIAVTLGIGTYTHPDFTNLHMLFGLLVALILLVLALMAVFTTGLRRLGAIGVVYAFIVPIFGVTQQMILAGEFHWLIETAHLAVGFGALALIGRISAGFVQRRKTASNAVGAPVEALPVTR